MNIFSILTLCSATLLSVAGAQAAEPSPFANWAAIVVAGDWHSQGNTPTTAFDNARREITKRLPAVGFTVTNIRQKIGRAHV